MRENDPAEVTVIVDRCCVTQVSVPKGVIVTVVDYDLDGNVDGSGKTCQIRVFTYEEEDGGED